MVRFLVRSVVSTIVTVLLVSIGLFLLIEVGSGDISVKILGVFATPEQRAQHLNFCAFWISRCKMQGMVRLAFNT